MVDNPTDLVGLTREAYRLVRVLDDGLTVLRETGPELAIAEHDYRRARAEAWGMVSGTAKQKEDEVNALTAGERQRRDTAEHLRRSAIESVRSRQAQLSAIQTLIRAHQSEVDLSKYGPRETP